MRTNEKFILIRTQERERHGRKETWYRFDGFENYTVCVTEVAGDNYRHIQIFTQQAPKYNAELYLTFGPEGDGINPTGVKIRAPHDCGGLVSKEDVNAYIASIRRAEAAAFEILHRFIRDWENTKQNCLQTFDPNRDAARVVPGVNYKVCRYKSFASPTKMRDEAIFDNLLDAIYCARSLNTEEMRYSEVMRKGCDRVVYAYNYDNEQTAHSALMQDDPDYLRVQPYISYFWQGGMMV